MNEKDDTAFNFIKLFPKFAEEEYGVFDLASGLICLNFSTDEWDEIPWQEIGEGSVVISNLSERRRDAVGTFYHEYFHFLQSISCGFLYRIACQILAVIVKHSINLEGTDINSYHNLKVLEKIREKISKVLIPLRAIHGSISALHIVESSAYFSELRMTSQVNNHKQMMEVLSSSKFGDEYTGCYRLADNLVGELAFDYFAHACAFALCFKTPAKYFPSIIRRLAADNKSRLERQGRTWQNMREFIGSPRRFVKDQPSFKHPWLWKYVRQIGKNMLPAFTSLPDNIDFVEKLPPPICFTNGYDGEREDVGKRSLFMTVSLDTIRPFASRRTKD